MRHSGFAIYFWGLGEQNRLLTECLEPAARSLTGRGDDVRFWYTRFDARGPHVFAVFSHPPGRTEPIRDLVEARVGSYLAEQPSRVDLSTRELEARHRACRGKVSCAADAEPGFGENNSYETFEHPDDGYPFGLCPAKTLRDAWRTLSCDLATWAVDVLRSYGERRPAGPAAQLLAAVDRELDHLGRDGEAYWRHHAVSLLPGLPERLRADPADLPADLYDRVGEGNRKRLEAVFSAVLRSEPPHPSLHRWVRAALDCGGKLGDRPWAPLRESVHGVLGQLGLPVRQQIPMILYAWLRAQFPMDGSPRSPRRTSGHSQESFRP